MRNLCQFRPARRFIVASLLLWHFASNPPPALALDPLPAEIPEVAVTGDESIRKLVAAIEQIKEPKARIKAQQQVFFRIRSLGREKFGPLLAQIERDAAGWEDKYSIAYLAEGLSEVDPEMMRRLSHVLSDERTLDRIWSLYSWRLAPVDRAKSREAIGNIKDAERRAIALIEFAQTATVSLDEVKQVLREIDEIGWPKYYSPSPYVISSAFSRLADDELDGAVAYVVGSLPPDSAAETLCYLSAHLRGGSKRPALADRALRAAERLVPECEDRAATVGKLLRYGFARLDRERAAQLKLEYSAPLIRLTPRIKRIPIGLADGGLEYSLDQAGELAKRTGVPEEMFVLGEVGYAAARNDVEEVLAWLRRQPASSARGRAAGSIADGLASRLANQYVDPKVHQSWIDLLGKEVLSISDPRQRREACEEILLATQAPKSKARITLPPEIRQEYGRLWDDPNAAPERPRDEWQTVWHSRLLPTDMQLAEITRLYSERNAYAAAKILDDSSLDGALRSEWFDKLLALTRTAQDRSQRAALLVGIARCLKDEDPAKSIAVLGEALQLVRPFRWSDAHNQHDVVGYLGSVTPPINPDQALGPIFVDYRDSGEPGVKAIWNHARTLDAADEREPLLEALAKVLVEQDQTARAAGVTTLLSDPARQARVWMEVARRLHGVNDEHR